MNRIILCYCFEFMGDNPNCPEHGHMFRKKFHFIDPPVLDNARCVCGDLKSEHVDGKCQASLNHPSSNLATCQCPGFSRA